MSTRVLVVEDDPAMRRLTVDLLRGEGYQVDASESVEGGWSQAVAARPELAVLDLQFPKGDGLDLCRRLKANAATRDCLVIILTARGASEHVVEGLKAGADDYLAKPFHEQEFLARVQALLRRRGAFQEPSDALEAGPLRLSRSEHRAWLEGAEVRLTLREFEVLAALVGSPGQALSREQIIDRAWGPGTAVVAKAVDVHINHLRQKLGEAAKVIVSVPQVGFRFDGDTGTPSESPKKPKK